MPLPRSFQETGFHSYAALLAQRRFRGIMIGTEGRANFGKTELYLSGPTPGTVLALDRGFEQCLDNVDPPATRQDIEGFAFNPVMVPLATQMKQEQYAELWRDYLRLYIATLGLKDSRLFVVDGETDSWEWQQLAAFGKLTQIPPILRTEVNAARRAMYARAKDSGKICIFTHRVKKQYETVYDTNHNPLPDPMSPGKDLREWYGNYERAGFGDYEYGFSLQIKHLYEPTSTRMNKVLKREVTVPARWGIQIQMCKSNRALEGTQLWGDDCNLPTLLQTVYPQIGLEEWGY